MYIVHFGITLLKVDFNVIQFLLWHQRKKFFLSQKQVETRWKSLTNIYWPVQYRWWNNGRYEHANLKSKFFGHFSVFKSWPFFSKREKKHYGLFNDTCGEKLEKQYNTKLCKNTILAATDYCLHNHWVMIIKSYNSIKSTDVWTTWFIK